MPSLGLLYLPYLLTIIIFISNYRYEILWVCFDSQLIFIGAVMLVWREGVGNGFFLG